MLALNLSFMGGIHYGFAAATYETAVEDEEIRRIKYQMIYSFVPAALSFSFSQMLLFASPLSIPSVIVAFSGLMVTQLVTLQVDMKCVEKGLAPQWFLRFRSFSFGFYMVITTLLFGVFYSKLDYLQRRNDKNRIENLKTALELEDLDFLKMVDDLAIDYDEKDLEGLTTA